MNLFSGDVFLLFSLLFSHHVVRFCVTENFVFKNELSTPSYEHLFLFQKFIYV